MTPKYPVGLSEEIVTASVIAKVSQHPGLETKFDPLLKKAQQVATSVAYPVWERRERVDTIISEVAKMVAPLSCCSKGCGACCKMAVTITNGEAEKIGKAYKITPRKAKPAFDREHEVQQYMNTVCPFLKKGVCSIYEHRPTPCRTHFNISDYPAICDTVKHPGCNVPTLYVFEPLWMASSLLAFENGEYPADIREFFPNGLEDAQSL